MANQIVQQAVQQSVLRVAQQLEEQLDSELHKLDNLQDDDLERIRQRRVQELRQQQERTKEWVAKGHGEYKEIFEEKEFFKEMKGEERMICHFFRDNWPCKVCTLELWLCPAKLLSRGSGCCCCAVLVQPACARKHTHTATPADC
jgi:hypothetical protein